MLCRFGAGNALFQALGGRENCDSGTIESPKATRVTYVEQDPDFAEGTTVRDAVFSADNPLMRYCAVLHARCVIRWQV